MLKQVLDWSHARSVSLLVAIVCTCAAISSTAVAQTEGTLVQRFIFTDYQEGSIDGWLREKGFRFEQDAKHRDKLDFDVSDNGLTVRAKEKLFAIMPNEAFNAPSFSFIEIDWGVNRFPKGASYEQGVRNEALMVIIFMGDERQPSGSMFIPDSPFFIGFFLCNGDDKVDHPYVGSYFQKSGRYVCKNKPEVGQLVTTRFDLKAGYGRFFDKEGTDDPGVSGLALAVDTSKSSERGMAAAFIKEIRVYK